MKTMLIAVSSLLLYSAASKAQNETSPGKDDKESRQEKREAAKAERDLMRKEKGVSYRSNQQFMQDFPVAENVIWNLSPYFEEATFTSGGITMTAYYDTDSKLVGTTTEKKFADIPGDGREYIKNHYKGYIVEKVILFDDNEDNETDMVLYNTGFEDADNYFAALKNEKELIIVKINMTGDVSYFKKL